MKFSKNQIITVDITDFTSEGNGVGRVDGMAVFVPCTAPGDRILARIIKVNKNYLVGKLEKLQKPSKLRINPDCKVFSRCGGCCYRHISYNAESEYKLKRVTDCIKRIGKIELVPEEILSADSPDRYRNKAQYPVSLDENGKLNIGFYAPRSHRITDCRDCLLQPEEFAKIVEIFARFVEQNKISVYDEQSGLGLVRHLYLRKGFATGEIMVCVVINGATLPKAQILIDSLTSDIPEIKTVCLNTNRGRTNVITGEKCKTLFGDGYITDELCGVKFRLSALSFYQVNREQAEKLFKKAAEYAGEKNTDTVIDLYCGAGAIGLSMAKNAGKIIGVEIVPDAVADAKINAELNSITNAEFICDDASGAARALAEKGIKPQVVLLDPPRKGCEPELIQTVSKEFCPERIVYVSCDPSTFARDAALFCENGYELKKATAVDMFPRTPHVETAGLFMKKID